MLFSVRGTNLLSPSGALLVHPLSPTALDPYWEHNETINKNTTPNFTSKMLDSECTPPHTTTHHLANQLLHTDTVTISSCRVGEPVRHSATGAHTLGPSPSHPVLCMRSSSERDDFPRHPGQPRPSECRIALAGARSVAWSRRESRFRQRHRAGCPRPSSKRSSCLLRRPSRVQC